MNNIEHRLKLTKHYTMLLCHWGQLKVFNQQIAMQINILRVIFKTFVSNAIKGAIPIKHATSQYVCIWHMYI